MADIENIAVSAVMAVIAGAEYLKSYIASKDTGPSLDGYICGFSKKGYSKKNEKGRAPVQIKGKESAATDLLQERISYSVDVADMKAFKRECGTIFFVVLFDKEDPSHTRIYYNPLLPYDINEILKDKEEQETVTIYLKPFPKGKEMEDTVLTFIDNRLKQSSIISQDKFKNYSIKEIFNEKTLKNPLSFNIGYTSIQGKDGDSGLSYFFNHDFYLYLKGEFDILIPAQHIHHLEMIHSEYSCSLCVEDTEYFDKCSVTILKDRTVYSFYSTKTTSEQEKTTDIVIQEANGDGELEKPIKDSTNPSKEPGEIEKYPFVIELFEDKDELGRSKANFTYHLAGNLAEKINTARFVIDLMQKKSYSLNGHKDNWNLPTEELKKFNLKDIKESLKLWEEIQKALDIVGCKETLSFEKFTDIDEKRLYCFKESVLNKRTVTFHETIPELATYQIGNLSLMLFFEKQKDGSYLIKKVPDRVLNCRVEDDEGNIYPTSFYTIFGTDSYEKISNLDLDSCVKSITAYENIIHFERANMSLLHMLSAYDNTGREDLLDAALKISTWMVEKEAPDTTISLMNFYQCLKRKGLFGEDERNSVKELTKDQENPEVLAGCYLLLDDSEDAAKEIKGLDKDRKDFFFNYPIMRFMDDKVRIGLEK